MSAKDSVGMESPKSEVTQRLADEQSEKVAQDVILQRVHGVEYRQYANWLGTEKRRPVLVEVMRQLRPWPESLYESLCKLSEKLYLIAEAGPLDTILEVLAKEWIEAHGEKFPYLEGNFKICHIILFSLLILNSDLHNESFEFTFTREQFIDNTLYAARQESKTVKLDEGLLREDVGRYYDAITEHALPLCPGKGMSDGGRRHSRQGGESSAGNSVRNVSSTSVSRKTSLFSLRPGSSILERTTTASTSISTSSRFSAVACGSEFYVHEPLDEKFEKGNDNLWSMDFEINYKMRKKSDTTEPHSGQLSLGHPSSGLFKSFKKNTYVDKMQLMIENVTKNMHTVRAIVRRGCIELHIPKSKTLLSHRVYFKSNKFSIRKLKLLGAFAECIGEEVIDKTGSKKPRCFFVELPTEQYTEQLLFECSTPEQCQKYVDSINFWASRITPVPDSQFELVSNLEYGWSQHLLNKFSNEQSSWKLGTGIKVHKWEPLYGVQTVCINLNANESGRLRMDSQLLHWKIFVSKLKDWINEHNSLKPDLYKVWDKSPHFDLVMNNWNEKYLFLNSQYHKYNQYERALNLGHEMIIQSSSVI